MSLEYGSQVSGDQPTVPFPVILVPFLVEIGKEIPSSQSSANLRSRQFPSKCHPFPPPSDNTHIENFLDFRQSVPTGLDGAVFTRDALFYSSETADPRPILQITFATDPNQPVPTQIQAQLTWNNGTPDPWITFATTGHNPGDVYLLLFSAFRSLNRPVCRFLPKLAQLQKRLFVTLAAWMNPSVPDVALCFAG